jgi:hypothetical protein
VRVRDYVTPAQERWLATQPDLIRDLARRIGGERKGAVHAEAWASLNGRPSRRLLDPAVDLAGPLPEGWILPERAQAPSKENP